MRHYAPQPTHIVHLAPAVTKRAILQGRQSALAAQVAAEHRNARAEDRPAKVTALSATLRAVKAQIVGLRG